MDGGRNNSDQGLTQADRQRLAKLLGLLGSSHADVRAAAGLAAHHLMQQRGMTWFDGWTDYTDRAEWRQTVDQCLRVPAALTQWETHFLRDIWHRRRLSLRQRDVLDEIAQRVLPQPAQRNSYRGR